MKRISHYYNPDAHRTKKHFNVVNEAGKDNYDLIDWSVGPEDIEVKYEKRKKYTKDSSKRIKLPDNMI